MATCNITVTRGTTKNAMGDPVPASTVVYTGAASITESSNQYFDQATQTPRTVRSLEMLVSSSADIQSGDYVHDDTWNINYVVHAVTQSTGPLYLPDKECDLKRVG